MSPRTIPSLLFVLALLCAWPGVSVAGPTPAADPIPPIDPKLRAVRPWMEHSDWSVRALAAFELRKRTELGAVWLATRMLAKETNDAAMAMALGVMEGRPRVELISEGGVALPDALLKLVEHHHPIVRARALRALQTLPPVALGDDLDAYRGWWKHARTSHGLEQARLLAAAKAPAVQPGEPGLAPATSFESSSDDRFYGQIERIRRDGLELCVIMDHTGSMSGVIGSAKARAVTLLRSLRRYVPKFRAGLVTYDDGARLRVPLTQNEEILRKGFRKVGAGGGADWEEGVDKGIMMALRQDVLGWSRKAQRVLVVVGDAPPHNQDMRRLVRILRAARDDVMYDHPVIVHTVSTASSSVELFPEIARAGGGEHVTLRDSAKLVEELVVLAFGGTYRDRVRNWMNEMDRLRKAADNPSKRKRK